MTKLPYRTEMLNHYKLFHLEWDKKIFSTTTISLLLLRCDLLRVSFSVNIHLLIGSKYISFLHDWQKFTQCIDFYVTLTAVVVVNNRGGNLNLIYLIRELWKREVILGKCFFFTCLAEIYTIYWFLCPSSTCTCMQGSPWIKMNTWLTLQLDKFSSYHMFFQAEN